MDKLEEITALAVGVMLLALMVLLFVGVAFSVIAAIGLIDLGQIALCAVNESRGGSWATI